MIEDLQKRALLRVERVPGALELFSREKKTKLTRKIAGGGGEIMYSVVSHHPIRVQGGIFRVMVHDASGDLFWLLMCTVNQIGLVLWPQEFQKQHEPQPVISI